MQRTASAWPWRWRRRNQQGYNQVQRCTRVVLGATAAYSSAPGGMHSVQQPGVHRYSRLHQRQPLLSELTLWNFHISPQPAASFQSPANTQWAPSQLLYSFLLLFRVSTASPCPAFLSVGSSEAPNLLLPFIFVKPRESAVEAGLNAVLQQVQR